MSDPTVESARQTSCLGRVDLSGDDVFARGARAIREVLRRLDALPRSDAWPIEASMWPAGPTKS
jgi:hypothetical protein